MQGAGSHCLSVTSNTRRHRHSAPSGSSRERKTLKSAVILHKNQADSARCHKYNKSCACKGGNMSNLSNYLAKVHLMQTVSEQPS